MTRYINSEYLDYHRAKSQLYIYTQRELLIGLMLRAVGEHKRILMEAYPSLYQEVMERNKSRDGSLPTDKPYDLVSDTSGT